VIHISVPLRYICVKYIPRNGKFRWRSIFKKWIGALGVHTLNQNRANYVDESVWCDEQTRIAYLFPTTFVGVRVHPVSSQLVYGNNITAETNPTCKIWWFLDYCWLFLDCFSSPPHPDRLWGPPSLLSNA